MSNNIKSVSVVIPTRNRLDSLNRTLASLKKQTKAPNEIIIIDSSDILLEEKYLTPNFTNTNLTIIHSKPSVCLQRNIGIEKSISEYIFLCDDDIEVSENYIESLVNYLTHNKSCSIASGLVLEKRNNKWQYSEKKTSFLKLVYNHIFGLSVWVDIKSTDFSNNKFVQNFVKNYLKKGNRIAKSGWPIVINYKQPVFETPIYGLGASIIRSKELKKNNFDTAFYENGIGDNYDLALNINSVISVLKTCKAYHYKEPTNRLNYLKSYFFRASALHYIVLKHKRFSFLNLIFFIWSLIGNSVIFLSKGRIKLLFCNYKLLLMIFFNQNIYKK